jgi:FkbM family methyltransferase
MSLNRIFSLIKRNVVASQLGVRFGRSASFRLPKSILLHGRRHILKLPDENGVKVAFIDLLLDDCYGCHALKRSSAQIKTVLDIGGNVGLFCLAARNVFPDAIIHTYEPNRQLEEYLANQAESADFNYFMEAVGFDDGMISLDLNEDSVQTRSKQNDDGNIPQIAFRKAIERLGGKVDFLKMDCEGGEWEMFEDKKSWQQIKHLSMEYHLFKPDQNEQRVKATIENLGFTITSFIPIGNFGLLTAKR